jgi:PST family polysaccharide transporter
MSTREQGRPAHFVAWLVGERLVRGTVTVVALAAVARHLAPAGFGILNFALAVVALATPLAQLGLESVLVRDLVRFPEKAGQLLGSSFALRLVAGCVIAGALVVSCHHSTLLGGASTALIPLCVIVIVQAGEVADCWFRSRVQSRVVVFIRGGVIVAGAAVKLILVATGAGIAAFAWVYSIEAAAFAAGLMLCIRVTGDRPPPMKFDAAVAADLLRECWGYALAGFLAAIAVRADQIAVAGMLGDNAAGLYYGALRLMELPILVATATATSLFPALAVADDDPAMHARLETVFGLISAISWITAIGATLTAPWVVPIILGAAYQAAWPVLVIHGWASLFFFSGMIRAYYLALRRAPGTQAIAAAMALGIQVLCNYALVPRLGIEGAALAFLATQFVNTWVVTLLLPVLRPCLILQARALWAPWKPSRWAGFAAAARGQ